jgi:hypothetical protein
VNASSEQRAAFGLPPAPDPTSDPEARGKWEKAMSLVGSAKQAAPGTLKATKLKAGPVAAVGNLSGSVNGSTASYAYNWSGVVSTNTLTSWNAKNSFVGVVSEFNVPVAQQAFGGFCDGTWDYEVSWNGIDGYTVGDVLQGGSLSGAYCSGGSRSTEYFAWVEWYPSYPIIGAFLVNPGDDIFVETYATGPKNGYVYIQDLTQQIYATYHLQPTQAPYLVGNSAEYIVERPCCNGSKFYALANYVGNFWANSYAWTGAGQYYYPTTSGSNTAIVTMVADNGQTQISQVLEVGANYQIFFTDENCAYSGGCAP